MIIPTITNPVFAMVTKGIQGYSRQQGYSIILGNTDYDEENEMGHLAAKILIDNIRGETSAPQQYTLETKLMIRGSTDKKENPEKRS